MKNRLYSIILIGSCFFIVLGCATYYQSNLRFNNYFLAGNMQGANKELDSRKKPEKQNDRFIYYANRGLVASMMNNFSLSNQYFETAHQLIDDYQSDYLREGMSMLFNSDIVVYKGEDYEHLYIYYFKALNFLKLGDYQAALVECRRMNNKLNFINDKYAGKNSLKKNAFMHLLMGLIYEANQEYNNAFIAYRNAVEIYEADYTQFFNLRCPLQLKKDLLKTAYLSGLNEELAFYSKRLNLPFDKSWIGKGAELVFMWHSGMCPVKDEWGINFSVLPGMNLITFYNAELGINFSFPMTQEEYANYKFSDLKFLRVAFPKLIERVPLYSEAELSDGTIKQPLEKAEDLNGVAFKTLKDRMTLEIGRSLLRLAIKKAAEVSISKQNQNAGALVSMFNAFTEKADTRQWQVLPHGIEYARIPVKSGKQDLQLSLRTNNGGSSKKSIQIDVPEGAKGMSFYTYSTLDAMPNNLRASNQWQDYR
jgi:hypothetical protein